MKLHPALALAALVIAAPALAQAPDPIAQRVERVLRQTPIIDGHNDLPWEIREKFADWRDPLDLEADTSHGTHPLQTDLPRMRRGHVGGQFWSVWIPTSLTGPAAIQTTLEQIDVVHRMVARYPQALELAGSAADIRRIERAGRIASLIGVEGGHQIGNSPAALRQFYTLGVRYMTLTHSSNNDFADSATDDPRHHGLTRFGLAIVHEMNRLGMLVDLSHVSAETMRQAIAASAAPVIFSHSSARAVTGHPRDVPDDVLRLLPANGGVAMVNFYPPFVSERVRANVAERAAETARLKSLYPGDPDRRRTELAAWVAAHPEPPATIADVADHADHIRQVAGVDHIGIGSDFDGMDGAHPQGLEGVDLYPALFAELARRGWSDADLAKLAGGNLLRALERAEQVAASMRNEPPLNATIEALDGPPAPPAH
ncbi:MAG: dipeptidase [Sphingomonadaceae bacterium]|nr:dipeptidase [Sphingomonadaceae bacterium]